jgi:hypothetical protein
MILVSVYACVMAVCFLPPDLPKGAAGDDEYVRSCVVTCGDVRRRVLWWRESSCGVVWRRVASCGAVLRRAAWCAMCCCGRSLPVLGCAREEPFSMDSRHPLCRAPGDGGCPAAPPPSLPPHPPSPQLYCGPEHGWQAHHAHQHHLLSGGSTGNHLEPLPRRDDFLPGNRVLAVRLCLGSVSIWGRGGGEGRRALTTCTCHSVPPALPQRNFPRSPPAGTSPFSLCWCLVQRPLPFVRLFDGLCLHMRMYVCL